jgi:hypothetical protein
MSTSTNEIFNNCSQIDYEKRTDAEKMVVWQHHEIMGLRDQISQLQKTNLVDVSPTIQVRRFSGEGSDLSLDSDMELYYGWDIDADKVADSLEVVKSMIKVTTSGDNVYDGSELHYQLVINFNSVVEMGVE